MKETRFNSLLATRFGVAAIEELEKERYGVLIGLSKGAVAATPFEDVIKGKKTLDMKLLEMARMLAR